MSQAEDTIKIEEVARLMGTSVRTVYRRLNKGMIPAVDHAEFGGRGKTFSRSVITERLRELHKFTPAKRRRNKRRFERNDLEHPMA